MRLSAAARAILARILVLLYRGLSATWRYRFVERTVFDAALDTGPAVFAFWHGEQLPVFAPHGHRGISGMASQSRDGDLLARAISLLGYGVIRGSSSRGGATALRAAEAGIAEGRSPALAVDGPRGPHHEPQLGALRIAAETSCPLIFVVSHAHTAVELRTWDRFVLPLPFTRVTVGYGRMEVQASNRGDLEHARAVLRDRMEALGATIRGDLSPPCRSLASTSVG